MIDKTSYPTMKDASEAKDFLPEPPIPTHKEWPYGVVITLTILITWAKAYSNRTMSIFLPGCLLLWSLRFFSVTSLSFSLFVNSQ